MKSMNKEEYIKRISALMNECNHERILYFVLRFLEKQVVSDGQIETASCGNN